MKVRQKNKQAEKWEFLLKEQREFISQCVPIPEDLLRRMNEIRAKAQENKESEDGY